jgi:hypothetical protein
VLGAVDRYSLRVLAYFQAANRPTNVAVVLLLPLVSVCSPSCQMQLLIAWASHHTRMLASSQCWCRTVHPACRWGIQLGNVLLWPRGRGNGGGGVWAREHITHTRPLASNRSGARQFTKTTCGYACLGLHLCGNRGGGCTCITVCIPQGYWPSHRAGAIQFTRYGNTSCGSNDSSGGMVSAVNLKDGWVLGLMFSC